MRPTILFIIASFMMLSSCSNQKFIRREKKQTKNWIANAWPACITHFSTVPTTFATDKYVYYESDSVRFYISSRFLLGFSTYDAAESKQQFNDFVKLYGNFFAKGMVSGAVFKTVYNYWGGGLVLIDEDNKIIEPELFGYYGKAVKILHVIPRKTKSSKTRGFEIWATSNKMESGWSGFPVFYLEVYNSKGKESQSLADFIDGAEKSCFSYLYSQL